MVTLFEEFLQQKYLVTYVPKESHAMVRRFGLLSLYGLVEFGRMDEFVDAAAKYIGRGKFQKVQKLSKEDIRNNPKLFYDLYAKVTGVSDAYKSIWCVFKEITPGISKRRDLFVKNSIMIRVPIHKLKNDWSYYLIAIPGKGRKWIKVTRDQMLEFGEKYNQRKYEEKFPNETKQNYAFSKIPHIAIAPTKGVIEV